MKSFIRVWLSISFISIALGIGLLIVAFASGANNDSWKEAWREKANLISMEETYEHVEKIDVDINYGEVRIVEGNEFSISAENIAKGELESYVEDGVWHIKEENGNYKRYFNLSFVFRHISINGDDFTPEIIISLPSDFVAEEANLKVAAGTLTADSIKAIKGNFNVDAGRMEIKELTVNDGSEYNVGTGEMILSNVNADSITVDCGVGHVVVDGTITGDNYINCGVGEVELDLVGDLEHYSYDINCGLGSVDLDGKSYHNIDTRIIDNSSAENSLELECGVGHISVDFH